MVQSEHSYTLRSFFGPSLPTLSTVLQIPPSKPSLSIPSFTPYLPHC